MTDDHGRYRETELAVTGSPEQVWQAIATGPGHAAWLFAAEIEPVTGGEMIIHRQPFGPDAAVSVTAWDPPRRFGFAESTPGAPAPLTTEILVEARSGGSCVVRVVCGFAAAGDEWEDLVEGAIEGWRMSLLVLRCYLTRFVGRPARAVDVISSIEATSAGRETAADALFTRLGLPAADRMPGRAFRTAAGAPELSGIVEHADAGYLLLRAEAPYPGLIAISCFWMGLDQPLTINLMGRLYDELDQAQLDRIRSDWQSWLDRQGAQLEQAR